MAGRRQPLAGPLRSLATPRELEIVEMLIVECHEALPRALDRTLSESGTTGGATPTRLYGKLLKDSPLLLSKDDLLAWMRNLDEVGVRYAEAWRIEKERMAGAEDGGPARKDLAAMSDRALLLACEAASLFPIAFAGAPDLARIELAELAHRCASRLHARVVPRFALTSPPIVDGVEKVLRMVTDAPSDTVGANGLLELFLLLSLAGVWFPKASAALVRGPAQMPEDLLPERNAGLQYDRLCRGVSAMERLVAVLRMPPPGSVGAPGSGPFGAHQLPLYNVIAPTGTAATG